MDPNPYKRVGAGLLMAKLRSSLDSDLIAAGFRASDRNDRSARRILYFDYEREQDVFSVRFEHSVGISAVVLTDMGNTIREIAFIEFGNAVRSPTELEARLDDFRSCVRTALRLL